MTVPRGTVREARISARVPQAVKHDLRAAVTELHARGLRTNESEVVEFLISTGVDVDAEDLEHRLRRWRATQDATP